MFTKMKTTKLDAFGVQDCGLTGDSVGNPPPMMICQML